MSQDDRRAPLISETINEPESAYWAARRALAAAMRDLNEYLCTSAISIEDTQTLTRRLRREIEGLQAQPQYPGAVAFARQADQGDFAVANNELLAIGGQSHPAAPGLSIWHDDDVTRGSVCCGWAFEGPPGHVHGGWIAAIFDHFMGMAHMRGGKPGMTGGLSIRYLAPTPLNQPLALVAYQEPAGERRTRITAELRCDDAVTATAEALFVQPRHRLFADAAADSLPS